MKFKIALFLLFLNSFAFGDDSVVGVKSDNEKIELAMKEAKKTIGDMIIRMNEKRNNEIYIIKEKIVDGSETEYFWIGPVTYVNGKFTGKILDDPFKIKNAKKGDLRVVDKADICDWAVAGKNGILAGGFVEKAIEKLEKDQKKSPSEETQTSEAKSINDKLKVKFNNENYIHRWSGNSLHEFTPEGQENLKTFTDMISIIPNNNVKTTADLATFATNLFNAYKQTKSLPIKSYSLPKDSKEPNEHVIIILLITNDLIECVFARLIIHEGQGLAIVYSHKVYGTKAGDETSKWLKDNGEKAESELLAIKDLPKIETLNKLPINEE